MHAHHTSKRHVSHTSTSPISASRITHHSSTSHTSHITHHTPQNITHSHHASYISTSRTQYITHNSFTLCTAHHTSHITRHVTHHTSHTTPTKGGCQLHDYLLVLHRRPVFQQEAHNLATGGCLHTHNTHRGGTEEPREHRGDTGHRGDMGAAAIVTSSSSMVLQYAGIRASSHNISSSTVNAAWCQ